MIGGFGLQTSCSAINQMSWLFCSVFSGWAISNSERHVICKVRRVNISTEDIDSGSTEDAVNSRDEYVSSGVFLSQKTVFLFLDCLLRLVAQSLLLNFNKVQGKFCCSMIW